MNENTLKIFLDKIRHKIIVYYFYQIKGVKNETNNQTNDDKNATKNH